MIYWPVWFSCLKNDDINFEDFEGQKEGNKNKYKVLLNIIKYYFIKSKYSFMSKYAKILFARQIIKTIINFIAFFAYIIYIINKINRSL